MFKKLNINYNNIKTKIFYDNTIYYLIGSIINKYYDQYYLLYEKEFNDKHYNNFISKNCNQKYPQKIELINTINNYEYFKNKLYYYLLVNIDHKNNMYQIKYKFGPRTKIIENEYVYFGLGYFQMGPLEFNSIN